MLAIPWHVSKHPRFTVDLQYDLSCDCVEHDVFERLEHSKDKVSACKLQYGREGWSEALNKFDKLVHLPLTIERPVSRAYYKLVEIIRTCVIRDVTKSFHMCEAPGGFAQASLHEFESIEEVHASSLSNGNRFSCAETKVKIHIFDDNDVQRNIVRQMHIESLGKNSFDFVTADGAFNNDDQPQYVERNFRPLLMSEIVMAVQLQKKGGTFVVKLFGMKLHFTLECIAWLSDMYSEVYVVKPFTSRGANDERYVVCRGFLGVIDDTSFFQFDFAQACPSRLLTLDDFWLSHMQQISIQMADEQYITLQKIFASFAQRGRGGRGRGRKRIVKER